MGGREKEEEEKVSNLVFYAQLTITVGETGASPEEGKTKKQKEGEEKEAKE